MEDVWDAIARDPGRGHISNTPKQINIIRAVRPSRRSTRTCRTSSAATAKPVKRHGSVTVDEFRQAGYYAPALMNFLALLGWSYDDKTTIMSPAELIERFTERVVPTCHLRLREARLAKRHAPARPLPTSTRTSS
jgi:glutamyl/glutaminyl-tRNA synthetase